MTDVVAETSWCFVVLPCSSWSPFGFAIRPHGQTLITSLSALPSASSSSGPSGWYPLRPAGDLQVLTGGGRYLKRRSDAQESHGGNSVWMERLRNHWPKRVPWSGKFPFKKKSGEVIMALVTKTPLYEDGELVGVITVSSDAAILKCTNSENQTYKSANNGQPGVQRLNFKRIQWPPRPTIAPMPQIASSVSNLASKLLPLLHSTDDTVSKKTSTDAVAGDEKLEKRGIYETKPNSRHFRKENTIVTEASEENDVGTKLMQFSGRIQVYAGGPLDIVNVALAAKLQTGVRAKYGKDNGNIKNSCADDNSGSNRMNYENDSSGGLVPLKGYQDVVNGADKEQNLQKCNSSLPMKRAETTACASRASTVSKDYSGDEVQKQQEGSQLPSSRESTGSHESLSGKGDYELNSVSECEIHWEDLQLREEIGQGSAFHYYAFYSSSLLRSSNAKMDVAVKVYFGNGYTEETLHDYRKEIDIMKRLRHPNVLLFMGAVYSQERLAIVTELLPRGSLFKNLHRNNQTLDIRRRLRVALDVARGMNYLHHRNPPIVHRDLKSSNLLVDKNWTVKVGDFGLSRLKDATLLNTKSGRGTVVGVVGFMDRRLELPEDLDPHVASIIDDCWRSFNMIEISFLVLTQVYLVKNGSSDPERRPSFEELIQRTLFLVNRIMRNTDQHIEWQLATLKTFFLLKVEGKFRERQTEEVGVEEEV
ncbi:hypothetical protein V8G54_016207 [Vigna mungo]|uniref:Protein kinase domain-containing protein n=1 Tax=Vigna mungo TaxID=3915 RepID=A0AAQ3NNK2_VIGMU